MNERRHKRYIYLHNTESFKEDFAYVLLLDIKNFASQDVTNPYDSIVLNNMLKQLGKKKSTYPRKVLYGMLQRFMSIKRRY